MNKHPVSGSRRHQRGATVLIIAIILLVLVTIAAAFAMNVGLFEQRTVGNELRAKAVAQVADAGLNHGIEVVKANAARITLPTTSGGWGGRWSQCNAASTNFPCVAEPDPVRRGSLYFYSDQTSAAPTSLVGAGSNVEPNTAIAQVGNFEVDYRVGALLCLIDNDDPSRCASYEDSYNGLVALTLVSRAFLEDDPDAMADVKATIASYRTLGAGPNVPIIASGNVNLSGGSAEIVPNPNAGGFGVALSVWSADTATFGDSASGGTGTVQTCHLGEFLGNYTNQGPSEYDGITICHNCRCNGLRPDKGLISGKSAGGGTGVGRDKSYDILDDQGNDQISPVSYFPDWTKTCPGSDRPGNRCDFEDNCFDDTLFEFVFGVNTINAPGCTAAIQTEEEFLEDAAEQQACNTLGMASSGLIWDDTGACTLPNGQVGTPSNPVFLVSDCDVRLSNNTVFYGVIFIRKTPACPGGVTFTANGGPTVYGSVVADGSVGINGNPKFIYNEAVIQAILSSPNFNRFGVVPGSWIDIVTTGE